MVRTVCVMIPFAVVISWSAAAGMERFVSTIQLQVWMCVGGSVRIRRFLAFDRTAHSLSSRVVCVSQDTVRTLAKHGKALSCVVFDSSIGGVWVSSFSD